MNQQEKELKFQTITSKPLFIGKVRTIIYKTKASGQYTKTIRAAIINHWYDDIVPGRLWERVREMDITEGVLIETVKYLLKPNDHNDTPNEKKPSIPRNEPNHPIIDINPGDAPIEWIEDKDEQPKLAEESKWDIR